MNAPARIVPPASAVGPEAPEARVFTIDDVFAMQAAGVIGPDERLELVEGALVRMQAKLNKHHIYQARLLRWFGRQLPDEVEVGPEPTAYLDAFNAPQPDITLAPRGVDIRGLAPADIHLVVEVADSSLRYDLGRKAALYARFGVPEYWVLDVNAPAVHVHRGPLPDGWREVRRYAADEAVAPLAFPAIATSLAALAPDLV